MFATFAPGTVYCGGPVYADGDINAAPISAPATLTVAKGSATQDGIVQGFGYITKQGGGILTLSGDSSFAGTKISEGTLRITGHIANTARVELRGDNTALVISGPDAVLSTSGGHHFIGSRQGVTLAIENGGTFESQRWNFQLATDRGTSAALNVTGAGSTATFASSLGVVGGVGSFSITDGGVVSNVGAVNFGSNGIHASSGRAHVLISGAGSRWDGDTGHIANATISILDGGVFHLGDARMGYLAGTESSTTISGADAELSLNSLEFGSEGRTSIAVGNGGKLTLRDGSPLTIASGATAIIGGGGVPIRAGTLNVASVSLDGGTLRFNHTEDAYTFDHAIAGDGLVDHAGLGHTTLGFDNSSFTGDTTVSGGTLAVDGKLGGFLTVLAGGRLEGFGEIGSTVNRSVGTIAPGNNGMGTLTIDGDYTGEGGTLEIESILADDNSATDRLVVTGSTSGSTNVRVINRGGEGAPTIEGIRIVEVNGASDGDFQLASDYTFEGEPAVIAGPYAYTLHKNGIATPEDGSWYLRSGYAPSADPSGDEAAPSPSPTPSPELPVLPIYQPGAPVYEAYPTFLRSMNTPPTLQQRSHGYAHGLDSPTEGVWTRAETRRTVTPATGSATLASRKTDVTRMRFGVERILLEDEAGNHVSGGIAAHLGQGTARVTSVFGNGSIDARNRGLGASLTYRGATGFYTDLQGQLSWFDSDLSSSILGPLSHENAGFAHALSVEAGKRIGLGENLSLAPQAQLTHSSVEFNRFTGPAGTSVSPDEGDSLKLRIGLGIDHAKSWTTPLGKSATARVYALANVNRELRDPARVKVGDVFLQSFEKPSSVGLSLGGDYSWNNDRFAVSGEVSVNAPIGGGGHSVTGGATLKIRF